MGDDHSPSQYFHYSNRRHPGTKKIFTGLDFTAVSEYPDPGHKEKLIGNYLSLIQLFSYGTKRKALFNYYHLVLTALIRRPEKEETNFHREENQD